MFFIGVRLTRVADLFSVAFYAENNFVISRENQDSLIQVRSRKHGLVEKEGRRGRLCYRARLFVASARLGESADTTPRTEVSISQAVRHTQVNPTKFFG